jgi:hypothetical protein
MCVPATRSKRAAQHEQTVRSCLRRRGPSCAILRHHVSMSATFNNEATWACISALHSATYLTHSPRSHSHTLDNIDFPPDIMLVSQSQHARQTRRTSDTTNPDMKQSASAPHTSRHRSALPGLRVVTRVCLPGRGRASRHLAQNRGARITTRAR